MVLSDTDRIRNLLGRYCERIDAGDFDGVGELFSAGVLAAGDGTPFASGAGEVAAFYRDGTQLHDGRPATKHLVLDTVFEEPELDGTVEVRSSYVVLQAVGTFALQPIITGRYVDRFGRDAEDDWCFRERRFFVDLLGDLSHHLADPAIARTGEG
jgi:hypothetical protein